MPGINVRMKGPSYDFSIELHSHYTIIEGVDSGEGKSWIYDTVSQDVIEGLATVVCDYPIIFAGVNNIDDSLNRDEMSVIFVDEIMISKSNSLRSALDKTKHLVVAITRDSYFVSATPLNGIYQVIVADDHFDIRSYNYDGKIPLCSSVEADVFVTEASEWKSEHALVSSLCTKYDKCVEIVAAKGKDRIAQVLLHLTKTRPNAKILVFMDLGNISTQLRLLTKRCKQNKNISFYNWLAFEELLCRSTFVLDNGNTYLPISQFNYFSLEKYFEKLLEALTKGLPFEYIHKSPEISKCYLEECPDCKACDVICENKLKAVLDTVIGKPLFAYFGQTLANNSANVSIRRIQNGED